MRPSRRCFSALSLGVLAACSADASGPEFSPDRYTVVRRNLPITIKENAELKAQHETVVRSQVEGQATIIYLIEEGKIVEKGEKLVELDASNLVDKKANQSIAVAKAKAALDQAAKNLDILGKELESKLKTAEGSLQIARMELEKFLGRPVPGSKQGKNRDMLEKLEALVKEEPARQEAGQQTSSGPGIQVEQVDPRTYRNLPDKIRQLLTVPVVDPETNEQRIESALDYDMGEMANRVLQQIDQIRLSMADLKVKEDTLSHSVRLASKNFITRNELDRDRLSYQSQVSKVTLAWNDLDLLVNFELPKTKIKLTQDVDNARIELERVKASNDAQRTRAQTDYQSSQAEYTLAKERLDNISEQIENAVIFAPTPGLVIYARIDTRGRSSETIQEGTTVRERQELIILPDTTKMQAIVKVQEAVVSQVKEGQLAHLTVEAYPDKVFTGRVVRVAQQADSNSGWMTSDRKVYETVVEFDGTNKDGLLKSRMAGAVTILVEDIPDVLTVPLSAVRRDRSVNYVWKETSSGFEPVPVRVGRHNAENVIIEEGVREGDRVLLVTPPGAPPVNFPQPEVPMPVLDGGADSAVREAGPGRPEASPAAAGRSAGAGENPGRDGAPRPRGGGSRFAPKRFAEMTPEELEQFKSSGLSMYPRLAERLRENGQEETADEIDRSLPLLQQALDENRLDDAQALADKLRKSMRAMARPRGGRVGEQGGGGPGGRGN